VRLDKDRGDGWREATAGATDSIILPTHITNNLPLIAAFGGALVSIAGASCMLQNYVAAGFFAVPSINEIGATLEYLGNEIAKIAGV